MFSETPTKKITVVESDIYSISDACQQILDDVRAKGFDADDIFAIHLSLEEALLNAVKHGNKNDPEKNIDIEYLVTEKKCDVYITDQGSGFCPDCLPDPRDEENLYKPGGRGVLLMRAYMDIVEFNERGNKVHMVKMKK